MRPQARAARFFNKFSSGWARPEYFLGWARPIYINRHPQPPAKYIRFSEISKSLYTCIVKINNLTGFWAWDIVGAMDGWTYCEGCEDWFLDEEDCNCEQ